MGNLLKIKCVNSGVNVQNLASTSVHDCASGKFSTISHVTDNSVVGGWVNVRQGGIRPPDQVWDQVLSTLTDNQFSFHTFLENVLGGFFTFYTLYTEKGKLKYD